MKSTKIKCTKKTVLLLLLTSQSFAQYQVKSSTINSGGSVSSNGSFELTASIGQTDASQSLSGDSYELNGGFWHENNDLIFRNNLDN